MEKIKDDAFPEGISIVVRCCNSATRIPPTLLHIAMQQDCGDIPVEVIVVDNASRDNTKRVAEQAWPAGTRMDFRIVEEKTPGAKFALERGFAEAKNAFVLIVDDDNWLCPDFVQRSYKHMKANPECGALGSRSEAVYEAPPPAWFNETMTGAIGPQAEASGDLTESRRWVWGAGMMLRNAALQDIRQLGFQSVLPGRVGKNMMAGEDPEFCYAFIIAGWRIHYDNDLFFRHFFPAGRVTWPKVRAFMTGFGAENVYLTPYQDYIRAMHAGNDAHAALEKACAPFDWQRWLRRYSWALRQAKPGAIFANKPGDEAVMKHLGRMGELNELRRSRHRLSDVHQKIKSFIQSCKDNGRH